MYRGGKTPPIKLFVRSVGEDGERVMVRVGGGWADLGEYLREYVVHHGRGNVSDSRIEVQGFSTSTQNSPNYPSQGRLTPVPSSGRSTPVSRPGSALEIRPSSSLAVRKTRPSTASQSDRPTLTAANVQKATETSAPLPFISARRRLSVSSVNSTSVASTTGDAPYASTSPSVSAASHSTPLGLAGPRPRARRVSISPESEAWLEDVMGQARKDSSYLKADKLRHMQRYDNENIVPLGNPNSNPTGTKHRSVSDIGNSSLNRRVFLRGLEKGGG